MKTYLSLQRDKSKSFNNKASVIETDSFLKLQSYNTIVAVINKKENTLKINGYYSQTTGRHIREFALQNGFPMPKKSQMQNKEVLTK